MYKPRNMSNTTEQSLILAVESSSRIGSVAIALNGNILGERAFSAPLRHSAEIFTAIRELLNEFNFKPGKIEYVYISVGPGSFTGLRIAVTLAKTMHLASAAKIVQVDTLDVVATNVINLISQNTESSADTEPPVVDTERVAVVLDAKRGQFFIAVYGRAMEGNSNTAGRAVWEKILPDCLMTPAEFLDRFACEAKPIWLLGDGLLYYQDKFQTDNVRFFNQQYWSPRACKVHLLGYQMALKEQFADALTLTPNYLRGPDVTIKTL